MITRGETPSQASTYWPLQALSEDSLSDSPTESLVAARLLLAWALVVKAHAGADNAVVFGFNISTLDCTTKTQGSLEPLILEVDENEPIAAHIAATSSQLDVWSGTASPSNSPPALHGSFHGFQSALLYSKDSLVEQRRQFSQNTEFNRTPLTILCSSHGERLTAEIAVNLAIADQDLVTFVISQFQHAFQQLYTTSPNQAIHCIRLAGPKDLEKAQALANTMSVATDTTAARPALVARAAVRLGSCLPKTLAASPPWASWESFS